MTSQSVLSRNKNSKEWKAVTFEESEDEDPGKEAKGKTLPRVDVLKIKTIGFDWACKIEKVQALHKIKRLHQTGGQHYSEKESKQGTQKEEKKVHWGTTCIWKNEWFWHQAGIH